MYLIDANVLIQAKNSYYGIDFAPGFWQWLILGNQRELIGSVEEVYKELRRGDDQLSEWARANRDFFISLDEQASSVLPTIVTWVEKSGYTPAAKNKFLTEQGDLGLIAWAGAHGHTVVTHEKSQPNALSKIRIPDVCAALDIETIDAFQMLRETRIRLVL